MVGGRPVGNREQFRREQPPFSEERCQPPPGVGVEEAGVVGGQDRIGLLAEPKQPPGSDVN
jgi:hypothetical protein